MADTANLDIDFDALTDPANRDRVAEIERAIRQIIYSEELDRQRGIDGMLLLWDWRMVPGTRITMCRSFAPRGMPVGRRPFADNTYGTLVADHQNERTRAKQREPRPPQQEEGAVGSDEPIVPAHHVRHTGPTGPAGSQEPEPPSETA